MQQSLEHPAIPEKNSFGYLHAIQTCTLAAVTSRSLAGKRVADVMPGLRHLVGDLEFSNSDPAELAARDDLDVFFLALPHGVASEYADPLFQAGKTVLDLSADFRLSSTALYEEYYGQAHPAPHLLERRALRHPRTRGRQVEERLAHRLPRLLSRPACNCRSCRCSRLASSSHLVS